MRERLRNIDYQKILIDIGVDIAAGILLAVSVQVFAVPAQFATGGVNGVALVLNHMFGFKMGVVVMIINIPLIMLCYKYLGKRFLANSIKSIIITSVILDLAEAKWVPAYTGSPLMAAIFSGILMGGGLALIFMRGSSTGGTDFVIMTINKLRPHMSVGVVTQIIDGVIILAGAYFFNNVDAVLYGIINVLILGVVMDRIMVGANVGKVAFIISESPEDIAAAIDDTVDRGSTFIKARGAYTKVDRNLVFCACATRELYKIKKVVEELDPGAFMVITDSREVYGEGFNPIIEKK